MQKVRDLTRKLSAGAPPQAESEFSEYGFESVTQTDRRLEPTFLLLHITLPL